MIFEVFRQERKGPAEQVHRRVLVGTLHCSLGRAPQMFRGPLREVGVVLPEFVAVPAGLLEVVAGEFVELDELARILFEPPSEAFVQLGAHDLR